MIVCTRCGFENEDSDTFCGSCAGFLEWEGKKVVEEAPAPEPEPEPEIVPEKAGIIDRVKDVIGIGEGKPADSTPGQGSGDATGTEPATVAEAEARPDPGPVSAPLSPPAAAAAAEPLVIPEPAAVPVPEPTPVAVPEPAPAVAAVGAPPTSSQASAAPAEARAVPRPSPAPAPSPAPVQARAVPQPAPAGPQAAPASAPQTAPVSTPKPAPVVSQPSPAAPPASKVAQPVQPTPARPAEPVVARAATPEQVAPARPDSGGPPGPVQPEAVKPGAAKARPAVKKSAPTRVINPGDKICGQCGEGNDPVRRFCRRCGGSLQEAAVFTLPWYRRFWRRLTTKKQRQAGERPRNRRRAVGGSGPGWLTSWVTRIVVLAIIVFAVLANVGPAKKPIRHRLSVWYHDVSGVVHSKYDPVHALVATASSSAAGHPAGLLIDGASNTSWQANKAGVGQTVDIKFANGTNIDKVGFLIGDTDSPQAYLTEPRPATIQVTFNGTDPYTQTIQLKDTASFQTFTAHAKAATSMVIKIEAVYPSSQGSNTSITEVEFFAKTG